MRQRPTARHRTGPAHEGGDGVPRPRTSSSAGEAGTVESKAPAAAPEPPALVDSPTNASDGALSASYLVVSLVMLVVCIAGSAAAVTKLGDALGVTTSMHPPTAAILGLAMLALALVWGGVSLWLVAIDARIMARQVWHVVTTRTWLPEPCGLWASSLLVLLAVAPMLWAVGGWLRET